MAKPATMPINQQEVVATLLKHRMLSKLQRPDLEQLAGIARPRVLAPRERLFAMGDPGNCIFIVMSGWIKLFRTGANGRDIVLELAGPGNVFGELAAINGTARGTDAKALAETRVLSIDGAALVQTLRRNPDALLELNRILCDRLSQANAQLEDTLSVSGEVRLARALIKLAGLSERPSADGLTIDLGLSQKEFGDMTGLSREVTNKQLAQWRDAGMIKLDGRVVVLADLRAIQGIAELG